MARQGVFSMLAMVLLLGALVSIPKGVESIGVCYGIRGSNLPLPSTVVSMLKSNGISSMRLYAPDHAVLDALRGTNISVAIGAPNDALPALAGSKVAAAAWVKDNINTQAYPTVSFRYVVVGNEVAGNLTAHLVPAMENMRHALDAAGLGHTVLVTTSVSQEILHVYSPPSAGNFTAEADCFMSHVIPFLARTGAPLMANVYPYLAWAWNTSAMDVKYALFTAPGVVVQDGAYGYQNLFDITVDAFYAAMDRHNGGSLVRLVVSESGWPSAGNKEASPDNARVYNQRLIEHVGGGTPRRPVAIETYIFMFNEDQKATGVEQHWGLFYPNMQHVYPIKFS